MVLNLILFLIFFITFPVYIYYYGNKIVKKDEVLPLSIKFFNLVYLLLLIYLFSVSAQALFVLGVVIYTSFLFKNRIFLKIRVNKSNSTPRKFLMLVYKFFIVLVWVFITFIVVATTLGIYALNYEKPIGKIGKHDPNVYVSACRVDSDKCYSLKAYYIPEACAPVEYDTRGAHGGQCYRDAYIEKIYFENGGYIKFEVDDCRSREENTWLCSTEDDWHIEIKERIRK